MPWSVVGVAIMISIAGVLIITLAVIITLVCVYRKDLNAAAQNLTFDNEEHERKKQAKLDACAAEAEKSRQDNAPQNVVSTENDINDIVKKQE